VVASTVEAAGRWEAVVGKVLGFVVELLGDDDFVVLGAGEDRIVVGRFIGVMITKIFVPAYIALLPRSRCRWLLL
jgi:hypothetical protein